MTDRHPQDLMANKPSSHWPTIGRRHGVTVGEGRGRRRPVRSDHTMISDTAWCRCGTLRAWVLRAVGARPRFGCRTEGP